MGLLKVAQERLILQETEAEMHEEQLLCKKILVTGADSYIGTSLEKWLLRDPCRYQVDTVDMLNDRWKSMSFIGYDAVFHVAGIAHVSSDPKLKNLYYQVNRDLAIKVAIKAKEAKIKQFIFMSSIIVYGSKNTVITDTTEPQPDDYYGDSKLQAERELMLLSDDAFHVVLLRPPMIYGNGCKGNYPILSRIALTVPFFPDIDNERSMLYIDNLCEFVRLVIDFDEMGTFYPQNDEYVKTSDLVRLIAKSHGRRVGTFRFFNWLVKMLWHFPGKIGCLVDKAFSSRVYLKSMSEYRENYRVVNFDMSVKLSEGMAQ